MLPNLTPEELAAPIRAETREYVRANSLFGPGGVGRRWLLLEDTRNTPGKTVHFQLQRDWEPNEDPLQAREVSCDARQHRVVATVADSVPQHDAEHTIRAVGRSQGERWAEHFDAAATALFGQLAHDAGETGHNLSSAWVSDGINRLKAANVRRPYLLVLHPQQWYDLGTQAGSPLTSTTSYGRIAEEFGYNYFIGELFGEMVVVHPCVPLANAGQDRRGAILGARALGLVWERDIECAWQGGRGVFLSDCTYGMTVIDPEAGVALTSDAA